MIEIKNASCYYGDYNVLRNVNLSIKKGQIVCLMGPNGCGKSTLIDHLLGRKYLSEGDIYLEGKNIRDYSVSEIAERISYIPQSHEQVFAYSVEQVVLMGCNAKSNASIFNSPKIEDLNTVHEALQQVNILHLAKRPYTKLSGGEVQLVLLARALAQKTPILILDEPCANLDLHNELLFLETILHLVKPQNKTIIMATHSPNHGFYFDNHVADTKVALFHRKELYRFGEVIDVLTQDVLAQVYEIDCKIITDKNTNQNHMITLSTLRKDEPDV